LAGVELKRTRTGKKLIEVDPEALADALLELAMRSGLQETGGSRFVLKMATFSM